MVTCRSRVRSTSVDRSVPSSLVWFAVVFPTTALLEGSIRVGFVPVSMSSAWAGGLDRRIASSRTVERLLVVDFGVCGGGHAGQCHCDGDPRHLARTDARATAADAVGRGGVCGIPFGCHGGPHSPTHDGLGQLPLLHPPQPSRSEEWMPKTDPSQGEHASTPRSARSTCAWNWKRPWRMGRWTIRCERIDTTREWVVPNVGTEPWFIDETRMPGQ